MSSSSEVRVWETELTLPTYLPAAPDKNPMFLENRVYQGSSGRIYPLPFTDRIAEQPRARVWKAVWLENEYLRVLILPEIGGRIHALEDRITGEDLLYRQPVIKPALVGLAGPWISGGIEFNWPQHHRPATFLPADFEVEHEADGAKTVWCSDHDPLVRMKGMHGVRLCPGRAVLEVRARAYNRTLLPQTFLWWANVATRVHEGYQSFFPPDVTYVADHAKRAMSRYPLCDALYYGIDYGRRARSGVPAEERPTRYLPPWARDASPTSPGKSAPGAIPDYPPHDLSWYGNIPTPCSYMAMGSEQDFFGGYDHRSGVGLVHVADHHIVPGKKQWTWGNHEFGYAWDRHLTDPTATGEYPPYIELMAGAYTDNQPDFSFLQPGETKAWSQFWYPIHRMGVVHHANLEASVHLTLSPGGFRLGVCTTQALRRARVTLAGPAGVKRWLIDLAPGRPFVVDRAPGSRPWPLGSTTLTLTDSRGRRVLSYQPRSAPRRSVPPPATEPPQPDAIPSLDELYLTGIHLEQYRHATRCPTVYWKEALRRDPGDSRVNTALGRWYLRRGEWSLAEECFRRGIDRLTRRNPNPVDGEAHYLLGICLRYRAEALGDHDPDSAENLAREAYAAWSKAAWNEAWAGAAFLALAEADCGKQQWETASRNLEKSLAHGNENSRARNLLVLALRRRGSSERAEAILRETLARDPLDWWARDLAGDRLTCDTQVCLDLAHDYARAGFFREAIAVLAKGRPRAEELPDQSWGAEPLVHYTRAWLLERAGQPRLARSAGRQGARAGTDYCFPARLEEIAILEAALRRQPDDARAAYYLGNLLYDRRRTEEAIRWWERSARLDRSFAGVRRNLGIGYFNAGRPVAQARRAFDQAARLAPSDARVVYERDQLWKRAAVGPERRYRELRRRLAVVFQRDDLSLEWCGILNSTGRSAEASQVLEQRQFQPWEGGEGLALAEFVRTRVLLGRRALEEGRAHEARNEFLAALQPPQSLGEARHVLSPPVEVFYWLGSACAKLGARGEARAWWRKATVGKTASGMGGGEELFFAGLAQQALGATRQAGRTFRQLLNSARELGAQEPRVDYFATSLPAMLLFREDPRRRQELAVRWRQAMALWGLGRKAAGLDCRKQVLQADPNHARARDAWWAPASRDRG